jgi:hypothetical protein
VKEENKMVIGPKKVLETITEEEERILHRVEQKIDQHLQHNYDGEYGGILPCSEDFRGIRSCVLEHLLDKYREAGWTRVEVNHDQREGSWIRFEYDRRTKR